MLPTLIQTLALASAGVLAPGSMTLVVLLLLSERGQRNGWGYALGYLGGYVTLGVSSVLLGSRWVSSGEEHTPSGVGFFFLGLGVLLPLLAMRNARRPAPASPSTPRLFTLLDQVTPAQAAALGALVTVINVKNLGLFSAALSVVILSPLPPPTKAGIAALAGMVFSSALWVPLAVTWIFPRRARTWLARLKAGLVRHSHALSIGAPLIFGLILCLKGVSTLR